MQEVDFDAIIKNANYFKNKIGKAKLCAVVKNDAYGHGIVQTARALCGIADWFAVATVEEAVAVEPFCKDVLILLPLFGQDITRAILHNFVLTVDSYETLERVYEFVPFGKIARVHLKVNTGMNRLGFLPSDIADVVAKMPHNVRIEGVFSHFYGQNIESCDNQYQEFVAAAGAVESLLCHSVVKHIANTTGVMLSNKYYLDMVRVGLGLYGYGEGLRPAKRVTAKVLAVRNLKKGDAVGYDGSFVARNDTRIAVIGTGYAYGFSRALLKAVVKIDGETFPIVGNICMGMCMVDIKDAQILVGSEAVLLGDGVNNANSQVIVYELLCNLR